MADDSKAQKLASARKKFKELKKEKIKKTSAVQKTKEEIVNSVESSREHTPDDLKCVNQTIETETQNTAEIPNYFTENYGNNVSPAVFFDTFSQSNNTDYPIQPNNSSINYFTDTKMETPQLTVDNSYQQYNTNSYFQQSDPVNHYFLDPYPSTTYSDPIKADGSGDGIQETIETTDIPNIENIPQISEENYVISKETIDTIDKIETVPQNSCLETLNQLSNEMAELIDPNADFILQNKQSDLELKNQELNSLLNQERIKNNKISASIQSYQQRIDELESELKEEKVNSDNRKQEEINNLRHELQNHTQTIGILVGENAELQANLNKMKLTTNEKSLECEELQTRLKASRSRVADLERELQTLKTEKIHYDTVGKEKIDEVEQLRKDYENLRVTKEDIQQDLLEAQEKLKQNQENNAELHNKINELSGQLSMANIKIQQLSTNSQNNEIFEQFSQEKIQMEKQISELNETIKSLTKDRNESNMQYQQYAQQLNAQITSLVNHIDQLKKENETLLQQEQNRIKHIGELEKQLQSLQNEQVSFAVQRSGNDMKVEVEKLSELVQKLESDLQEKQGICDNLNSEKDHLTKDLILAEDKIKELEDTIEDLRGNQPDNVKLLAIMESDKVAASRAISQNTELKAQMESMQEVFMKLNNDKVELTEKIVAEQKLNKELMDKLQTTEHHLQTLADAIAIKDKELCHLRENSVELNKQVIQTEQLSDRLRHYEAQNHSSLSLQQELQKAQQTIATLEAEIILLRAPENMGMKVENKVESESDEIKILQEKLEQLELKNKELESRLESNQKSNGELGFENSNKNIDSNHNDSLDKDSAMKYLEEKFLKTMNDIANLTEEKQRLEHLVLQLQSETETIGEYVALYQHQRSILKQKAIEKDQQLNQLANDREQMKSKIEKLNELVTKLVVEKGNITSELLQHHENLNMNSHDLCEEHAKIHNEINKITVDTIKANNGECDNQNTETAEQIIALLSEIKTSNLVQPTEQYHHCPWCSGQLITV